MKKIFFLLTLFGFLTLGTSAVYAQEGEEAATEQTEGAENQSFHRVLMEQFIAGGKEFMSLPLICLILGLAFCIERLITLTLASTNVKAFMGQIDKKLAAGDVDGAKKLAKSNRSPVASIVYQGLDRVKDGMDIVEKSIVSYGSVQMGMLEKGLSWIGLFIALAPMLGFLGTVIGMINAFAAIEVAGDISPRIVAGGIKVALLTTAFGLVVAIILQIFYNYIVSRVDALVNQMEDASISFVDMLTKHNVAGK